MDEKQILDMTTANPLPPMDPAVSAAISTAIRELVAPLMASLAEVMTNNTEALQYLAGQQKVQTDRMEALERQIRLNTLVTPAQVRYLNDAIRSRARELLAKKNLDEDKKAVTRLSAAIRKSVLSRYGVAAIHEIPKHEYSVAMQQVDTWNDTVVMLDITREARKRLYGPTLTNVVASALTEDGHHV